MKRSSLGQILLPTDDDWAQFLKSRTDINIFQLPVWSKLISEFYGFVSFVVITVDTEGEISAGIPMMEISRFGRKSWKAIPFTDFCIPIYRDTDTLNQLSNFLITLQEENGLRTMEIRADLPFNHGFHRTSDFWTHKLYLNKDIDSVFGRVHQMHVRNIGVAKRNNVEIKVKTDLGSLKEFYQLHIGNRRRQGVLAQPWGFMNSIHHNLISKGQSFLLNAYSRERCISSALFLRGGNTLTYKYGASNDTGRKLRAYNLLFWKAIQWGCENGYAVLDFGRTAQSNQGLRKFKSRWGAEEEPLVYSFLPKSQRMFSNHPLRRMLNTVIRISPTWMCRLSGEMLYRYFG